MNLRQILILCGNKQEANKHVLTSSTLLSCLRASLSPWSISAAAAAKACLALCDPIDSSPLGSALPGILQARTLEWVAISFSSA